MKRAFLLAMVLGLLVPSSAGAVTLINPDGSVAQPFQTWADAAKVPTVGSTIVVYRDTSVCDTAQVGGCASRDGRFIGIDPSATRYVLLHELGHEFDFQMPDWKRVVFAKIFPFSVPVTWTIPAEAAPHSAPTYEEFWADNYAGCALGSPPLGNAYAMPTKHAFRRACRLIRQPN